jgi:peptide/nickel transport system substrate-binding protein
MKKLVFLVALLATGLCGAAEAATLRYASAYEPGTMDPHAVGSSYATRVLNMVYDTLVARDEDFRIAPGLALRWSVAGPTTWRFRLRQNVKFHDGTPFTADDVVFSVERALSPTSQVRFNLPNVTGAKKVDELTVDILTSAPTPVLPMALTNLRIMSRAWSLKNRAEKPQDYGAKQDTYASRNANGTGPYKLKEWVPDVRTVLVANAGYWGPHGNVDEAQYLVVSSAATRLAGLISGEIDFVIDPALQDVERLERTPGVKLVKGPSRSTQFMTFDHARDKLLEGGKNPFKDRRVREAVRAAIDVDALNTKIMRNLGTPGRALYTPAVDGFDKRFDKGVPYQPDRARALLREAGFPDGFSVTLQCSASQPADALCQGVSGMLARVGIKVSYQALPFNNLMPKVTSREVSFVAFGWTPATDIEGVMVPLVHTPNAAGDGDYNAGRYSNPAIDALIDRARSELDPVKRTALLTEAMVAADEDVAYITLSYRNVFWAMRDKVRTKPRPNDLLDLRYVNLD